MKQRSLATVATAHSGFERYRKPTRRDASLATLLMQVPWTAMREKNRTVLHRGRQWSRPPTGLKRMLRIHSDLVSTPREAANPPAREGGPERPARPAGRQVGGAWRLSMGSWSGSPHSPSTPACKRPAVHEAVGLGAPKALSKGRVAKINPGEQSFLPDLQPNSPAIGHRDGVLEKRCSQE